jgi:glucosylceramidase
MAWLGGETVEKRSRREFLKTAAAAGAMVGAVERGWAAGPVRIWSTFRDKRHAAGEALAWKPAAEIASDAIRLDPATVRQEMLGFGAAMTDASCWVLSQIPSERRAALMHELFAPGEMEMNVCRTCIGSSDYAKEMFNYDEGTEDDPELKKFSIDHDKGYVLPMLREARRENADLFLFSSPWSPPAWMKFNRSMLGGTIRKSALEPYSRYLLKFVEAYKAEGVAVNAITVQNEVDTTVDGRYPSCLWAQEDEILFVGRYLGPLFRKSDCPTKIWVLDHNFTLWGRAIAELSDKGVYEYADGVAWHGYAGEPSGMTPVHNAFPEKSAYFTEGGPARRAPGQGRPADNDPLTAWAPWAEWANDTIRNWARSITVWNIALDEYGTPYIGLREGAGGVAAPAAEQQRTRRIGAGVITVENGTHEVTRGARFWAMAHYSKHVKRGAKVFATDGIGESAGNPVSHAGFRNPDGSYVAVLANHGPERRAQLLMGTDALEVEGGGVAVLPVGGGGGGAGGGRPEAGWTE